MLIDLPAAKAEEKAATTIEIQQAGNTRTAAMTLPVSPDHTWTVLTNYVATGEAMPDISKVQLLSRQGNVIRLHQTYKASYTFGLTISATLGGVGLERFIGGLNDSPSLGGGFAPL